MLTYSVEFYGSGLYSAAETPEMARILAWAFSMDGHDYYVLNLGVQGCFVVDLTTGQWAEWSGSGRVGLPTKIGASLQDMNILGGLEGLLVFRSDYFEDYDGRMQSFLVGNVVVRNFEFKDCFGIFVSGALSNNEDYAVELVYSDDSGETWQAAERHFGIENGELSWTSVGIITPPGRTVALVDDGAYSRVFNMNMEDGNGS